MTLPFDVAAMPMMLLFLSTPQPLTLQQEADVNKAIAMFEAGALHSVQLPAPQKAPLVSILVLAPLKTKQKSFVVGSFQFDTAPSNPAVVMSVFNVLGSPDARRVFAVRFAARMRAGVLQARWVTMAPPAEKQEVPLTATSTLTADELYSILTAPQLE